MEPTLWIQTSPSRQITIFSRLCMRPVSSQVAKPSAALQNPYLKSASYTLPDGTIIIDPRKPVGPNLSNALLNEHLRKASYQVPEGSLHIPGQKPNLSFALRQNRTLRSQGLYQLSDSSVLSGVPNPTPRISPELCRWTKYVDSSSGYQMTLF
ncbi:hypothetical protein WMY93_005759 [Mugilogobius chulae]|uniref:Uncharacterized protein n=1 Tax=Mugilogobius chulae TaxID=88201 RepID=A0AAW0PTI6_9GOBI